MGNIFIFCSHYYRSKAIGRAEPGRWIFQQGHLTWRAVVWRSHCLRRHNKNSFQKWGRQSAERALFKHDCLWQGVTHCHCVFSLSFLCRILACCFLVCLCCRIITQWKKDEYNNKWAFWAHLCASFPCNRLGIMDRSTSRIYNRQMP